MSPKPTSDALLSAIITKGSLKQGVYHTAMKGFTAMKREAEHFITSNKPAVKKAAYPLLFEYADRGEFEFQLKFGSDILIFFMHSNVFEIPRDHLIMKSSYIREDKTRSYCGIIHIYNFLADSFKYNRTSDTGYCIARIYINRENHYFTEGKKEIGMMYNNFATAAFDKSAIRNILHTSMEYTIHFDLLTPPFDTIKEVTVNEIQTTLDAMSLKTGKRLGFRFQADE